MLNKMEKAALEHARQWREYDRSPQAAIDRRVDKARRKAADIKAGHLPTCSLTKCAPDCPKNK